MSTRTRRAKAMTPQQRAAALIDDVRDLNWVIEFVRRGQRGTVHIVGPAGDQLGYDSVVEALLFRKFRTVCGKQVRVASPGGTLDEFPDEKLCHACHGAFSPDTQATVFEHATEDFQSCRGHNSTIYRQNPERWAARATAR